MENAGRQAAGEVRVLTEARGIKVSASQIAVLCGGGNNGGDGYVAARYLYNYGAVVTIYSVKDPKTLQGDTALHHGICSQMGIDIRPVLDAGQLEIESKRWGQAHVLVDALLGTGFSGEVRSELASVIDRCNTLVSPRVVAVDVPSGLDCDTGQPAVSTIRADLTVTFVSMKVGFSNPEAAVCLGRVVVADIGTPPQLVERVTQV